MKITLQPNEYPKIMQRVKDAGFDTFEHQDYDMNIIGERNPNGTVDAFDDWIHVCYLEGGQWQWYAYKCTTDAGKYWLEHANTKGTAILVHNRQYKGAYKLGLHRGQYLALIQRGNEVCVWRDRDGDLEHDWGQNIECGYFGINIHRASAVSESERVNKYSAGCQVIADPEEFEHFLYVCQLQVQHLGYEKFSYTLLLGE
jgi:hypothetical protein